MNNLRIEAGSKTPVISANARTGEMSLSGICVPEDAVNFFFPFKQWLDEYIKSPQETTVFTIDLRYFNTATSRILLNILRIIVPLADQGKDVAIYWIYEEDDVDMEEAGEDYREIVGDCFMLRSKPVVK